MRLRGKVALVTGAAKRVGKHIALGLADQGMHVAITYNNSAAPAKRLVKELESKGVKALAVQVDQRIPEQVQEGVAQILKTFKRIDLLVNNASSYYPTPWKEVTPEQWYDCIDSNLTGPWFFAQSAGLAMKKRKQGKIINIIDVSVHSPWRQYLPYSAAKGGLYTLTLGLAKVLAPEVQVNGIAPGPILWPPDISEKDKKAALDKTLLKRKGSPEDILQAILFFAKGTDFVTGTVLPVEGGRLLS